MVKARELLIMAGAGVSLGIAATVLDTTVFMPSDGQQWAEGVLASGQPLTMREMSTLSQIVNGQSEGASGYPGYSGSNYTTGAPAVAAVTGLQNGLPSRSALDQSSASRAWLAPEQRASTQAYGPATADFGDSAVNNAGAIDVRTGQHYAPAGAGYVNTQNGTYYTPSGPNGVVDTRTGAFIPTVP